MNRANEKANPHSLHNISAVQNNRRDSRSAGVLFQGRAGIVLHDL